MEECLKGQTKQANFLEYLIHETMLIRISLINWSFNVAYFKEKVIRFFWKLPTFLFLLYNRLSLPKLPWTDLWSSFDSQKHLRKTRIFIIFLGGTFIELKTAKTKPLMDTKANITWHLYKNFMSSFSP